MSGLTLVQVMACCSITSHYLNKLPKQNLNSTVHMGATSLWVPKLPFAMTSLNIILLKPLPHLPGTNELTHCSMGKVQFIRYWLSRTMALYVITHTPSERYQKITVRVMVELVLMTIAMAVSTTKQCQSMQGLAFLFPSVSFSTHWSFNKMADILQTLV